MNVAFIVIERLNFLSSELFVWGKRKACVFKDEIETCKLDLDRLRQSSNSASMAKFQNLKQKLSSLLSQEEVYWKQRAKEHWLKDSDFNTRFFHTSMIAKNERNRIKSLTDGNGINYTDPVNLCIIVKDYFMDLFHPMTQPINPSS